MFPATEHGYDKRLWPPSNAFSHGLQVTINAFTKEKTSAYLITISRLSNNSLRWNLRLRKILEKW